MNTMMTALLIAIACAPFGQTRLFAQEFVGQEAIIGALGALGFQSAKSGPPRQAADATAVAPHGLVPPKDLYPIRGVDVSAYQGDIDWSKVKTADISFAYVKATEGADFTDRTFSANWNGARRAGLRRGAYHFYNLCKSGGLQADHFLKIVPVDADALPVAIDMETSRSCKALPTKAALRQSLALFIAKVKAAYGKTPVVYVNDDFYGRYFNGEKDSHLIWITDTIAPPELPDKRDWTFWQFSFKGKVAGIASDVDLDVYNGDAEKFAKLDGPQTIMLANARR